MKTVEFFKKEIEKLRNESAEAKKNLDAQKVDEKYAKKLRGKIKRNKKKVEDYLFYKSYIETNPTKEFLIKESDRLSSRINRFVELYVPVNEELVSKKVAAKHKADYEKEMGVPKLRKQLAAVNFINN